MDLDVLLPFHRVDQYLVDSISSLENSKGVSINLILIDDRKDKSVKLGSIFRGLTSYNIVPTSGGVGYGRALEIGSKFLSADVVALHNSDDLVHPSRFRTQIRLLEESDLCLTGIKRVNAQGRGIRSLAGEFNPESYDPRSLLLGSYGANATWCMTQDWWKRNSFFDDKDCLDWRIALNAFVGSSISYTPEELYFYRKHSGQGTAVRSKSFDELSIVYREWSKYANLFGLGEYSYSCFLVFAVPWVSPHLWDPVELKQFKNQILSLYSEGDTYMTPIIKSLIRRRFLYALRSKNFVFEKFLAFKEGFQVIPEVSIDMLINCLASLL
jgi:glycosyltransferase involved in cell wall biosynthesis